MSQWAYLLDGETITSQKFSENPYVGYPITFVGRLGKPAPAEHFVVSGVDETARTITLERQR